MGKPLPIMYRGIKKAYLAFDVDLAGDKAALEVAQRLGERGIACYRVQFPENMDANDFVCSKGFRPALLRELVVKAVAMPTTAAEEKNLAVTPQTSASEGAIESPISQPQISPSAAVSSASLEK